MIRVIVGHPPFRSKGLRVEREQYGDKTVIHNYGHGGGPSGERGFLHMFPRGDVIVLGGMYKLGDSSRNVEADETERIVRGHHKLFESFG